MIPTPTTDALRRAAELCEFCPKMCRFSCPVSEAAQREAWTPWGKVTLAALTAAVDRAPDASASLAFHACTGCLRCQEHCAHQQDVPTLLFAARAVAVKSGTSPAAASAVAQAYAARGHAQPTDPLPALQALRAEAAQAREAALGAAGSDSSPDRSSGTALQITRTDGSAALPPPTLIPGCEALTSQSPGTFGGSLASDALFAARALGAPLDVAPDGAVCCGRKLLEAGHTEEFARHAAKVRDALPAGGRLVFLQPACARTVQERYAAHSAALPEGTIVEHATQYLARALALRPDLLSRPKLPGAVAFHDPCELARGLGETDAPRRLIAAAVAGKVREAVRCGKDASCCGASGLFPETFPTVAPKIAAERKQELADTGAPAFTASPACGAALGLPDVVSLIARWLAPL